MAETRVSGGSVREHDSPRRRSRRSPKPNLNNGAICQTAIASASGGHVSDEWRARRGGGWDLALTRRSRRRLAEAKELSMRGLGAFQMAQMKHRDARVAQLCQHLHQAIDLLEQSRLFHSVSRKSLRRPRRRTRCRS